MRRRTFLAAAAGSALAACTAQVTTRATASPTWRPDLAAAIDEKWAAAGPRTLTPLP